MIFIGISNFSFGDRFTKTELYVDVAGLGLGAHRRAGAGAGQARYTRPRYTRYPKQVIILYLSLSHAYKSRPLSCLKYT